MMDNWGLYPTHSEHLNNNQEAIRIGFIETDTEFIIRASHPNYPPKWYVDFAKSIEAKLLFQDLDGYGEKLAWDIANDSEKMSNVLYVVYFIKYYDNYTPFTREFLNLPSLEIVSE